MQHAASCNHHTFCFLFFYVAILLFDLRNSCSSGLGCRDKDSFFSTFEFGMHAYLDLPVQLNDAFISSTSDNCYFTEERVNPMWPAPIKCYYSFAKGLKNNSDHRMLNIALIIAQKIRACSIAVGHH